MVLSDCPELREISWRCVIIDEAHRLKNRNCKLLDSLKMLDLVRIKKMKYTLFFCFVFFFLQLNVLMDSLRNTKCCWPARLFRTPWRSFSASFTSWSQLSSRLKSNSSESLETSKLRSRWETHKSGNSLPLCLKLYMQLIAILPNYPFNRFRNSSPF